LINKSLRLFFYFLNFAFPQKIQIRKKMSEIGDESETVDRSEKARVLLFSFCNLFFHENTCFKNFKIIK